MNKIDLYDHYVDGGLTYLEATSAVKNNPDAIICSKAGYTLMGAFVFIHSPEGNEFWYEIAERIGFK